MNESIIWWFHYSMKWEFDDFIIQWIENLMNLGFDELRIWQIENSTNWEFNLSTCHHLFFTASEYLLHSLFLPGITSLSFFRLEERSKSNWMRLWLWGIASKWERKWKNRQKLTRFSVGGKLFPWFYFFVLLVHSKHPWCGTFFFF